MKRIERKTPAPDRVVRPLLPLLLAVFFFLGGCDLAKVISSSSHTTSKATVLKVYSQSDGGHQFVAYVVDAGGREVVVSDPLGRSTHKAGDTIEFMTQKMEMPGGKKILSYTLLK